MHSLLDFLWHDVDWGYWLTERPHNIAWWDGGNPRYVWVCPLVVMLCLAATMTAAAAFASWCWQRRRGPINLD